LGIVLGASVGGAAGVLYASKTLFISPDNFTLQVSILILACVFLVEWEISGALSQEQ
jgi:ABC-type branched-subunit amino acid transport system permease subunit